MTRRSNEACLFEPPDHLIHVKALRGSNGYICCLGSEGLRSQAAMTEPSFLPAPVLAALLFPWPKCCTENGMKSLPRSGSSKPALD